MNKKKVFVRALFVAAVVFMGCSNPASDSSGGSSTVDDVAVNDVVTEAIEAGIVINANAKPVESKSVFENSVMPEIVSSIKNSNLGSNLKSLSNVTTESGRSAFRATITDSDIKNALDDLNKQSDAFNKELNKLSSTGSCNASIDWDFPAGDYTIDNGILLNVGGISVDANFNAALTDTSFDMSGYGGFDFDLTSIANFKKAYGINVIPYGRVAFRGNSNVDGYYKVTESSEDYKVNTNVYYGYSGAWIFNLTNYAGVIKMDLEITADAAIDQKFIEKYSNMFSGRITESMLTKSFFDDLPANAKFNISVYDIAGNKLFSFFDANSLYEVYKQISDFGKQIK